MNLCERVWNELEGRYGSDLRVVIRYLPSEFETRMRDDVREAYTEAEVKAMVDDVIVDQLGMGHRGSVAKTGDLHGFVRTFDDAWVLLWPDSLDEKSGFLVSLQRDSPSTEMNAIESITQYLDDDIAPRVD